MNPNSLTRKSFRALSMLALLALALGGTTHATKAASFTVDTRVDAVDANPGDGLCATVEGRCTLRAAAQETNALPGADTITLPAGSYVLSIPWAGEDAAATGDLDITDDLMLMGAGLNATAINGVIGDRVLHIPGSAVVTLQSVTIARGSADNGGGIYNSGTLTVLGTRLYQNAASSTGGGIYNCCLSNSAVTLSHSRISANSAGVYGGGIVNHYGTLTVSHSTVSANAAYLDGGGIFNHNQGTLIVSHSKIAGNAAPYNGGIANYTGGVTVSHTTISDNRATCCYGGGLFNSCCSSDSTVKISHSTISGNSAAGSGGGIFNDGTLTLSNSTVSGNSASYGGGIYNYGSAAPPTLRVSNSTIAGNSASYGGGFYKYTGVAIFKGSILGANTASSSPDCAGTVASEGYNLVGDNSGCTFNEATGDLIGTQDDPIDPLLGPLQDNGGPTWTRALLEESPAIDTGSPDHCPPKDQRGYPRPVDGDADGVAICDIGSVEYRSMPEQRGR